MGTTKDSKLNKAHLETLTKTRSVVGYLGEKEQFSWWQSTFFSPSSQLFLGHVFCKTCFVAQYTGVTRAAMAVHDKYIGLGHVYHLFRLPEDMEQAIHQLLHDPSLSQEIMSLITSRETALAFLKQDTAIASNSSDVGPSRVGKIAALRDVGSWQAVADQYAQAFTQGSEIYPYFADPS